MMDEGDKTENCGPSRPTLAALEEKSLLSGSAVEWRRMQLYVEELEKEFSQLEADLASAKSTEVKLRKRLADAKRKKRVYARRLAHKDHEIREYSAQVANLKASLGSSATIDPAVNVHFVRVCAELAAHKTRLEEFQSEFKAWEFTPDSKTGKRLMARSRLLYQENEALDKVVSSGRLAKLESDLTQQKMSEMDEVLQEMDDDAEGMQGTICLLRGELRKSKDNATATATQPAAPEPTIDYSVANDEEENPILNEDDDDADDEWDSDQPLAKKCRRGSD